MKGEEFLLNKIDLENSFRKKCPFPEPGKNISLEEARKWTRQLQERARRIEDPILAAAVKKVLGYYCGLCQDWFIRIIDSEGKVNEIRGIASSSSSLAGSHEPVIINLPPGITFEKIAPYLTV